MSEGPIYTYEDRELSWLSFNARVLQEAQDSTVPLYERLFFLGVFSSNLDEFYRVRVASQRSLLRLGKKSVRKLGYNPRRLLGDIRHDVVDKQEEFGRTLAGVLQELEERGFVRVRRVTENGDQREWTRRFFEAEVRPLLKPELLQGPDSGPFLKDRGLYLVVELWPHESADDVLSEPDYAMVEIPGAPLPRFVSPDSSDDDIPTVFFLDDIIRLNLPGLFPEYDVGDAYSIKISRDAELYLDEDDIKDEFARGLAKLIRKSLSRRETGLPCRFLYDKEIPFELLERLKDSLSLEPADLVLGGRYHNLNDLMEFPRIGPRDLSFEPLPPLAHPDLEGAGSLFQAISEKDHILNVPYQRFDYVLQFLEEAAVDPNVEAIWITLYRVAKSSAVVDALVKAARSGKRVTAFVEAKARFDEARNLESADRLEAAGAIVLHSMPGLKVHAKTALVARTEGGEDHLYAYLGTGNFNERTALVYSDVGLFTADPRLTNEVRSVFDMLGGLVKGVMAAPEFEHLLVAPHAMRGKFYRLIDAETGRARKGQEAWMLLKMNSLEDPKIIERLYEASRAGVKIRIVVRGICRLVPGVNGQSENIQVTSIIDRFLEHARFYAFANNGEPLLYLASADWMKRNLSRRVEVAFPIYDDRLRTELFNFLEFQLQDNAKARVIRRDGDNRYISTGGDPSFRSQMETYAHFLNAFSPTRS